MEIGIAPAFPERRTIELRKYTTATHLICKRNGNYSGAVSTLSLNYNEHRLFVMLARLVIEGWEVSKDAETQQLLNELWKQEWRKT